MRRLPFPLLWLSLAALACDDGCGCGRGDAGGDAAIVAPPPTRPEELSVEASLGGGADTLRAFRDRLPEPFASAVPGDPGDLLDRVARDLGVGGRIAGDADVWMVSVRDDGARSVLAVRVARDEGDRPLGAGVPVMSGAPHGGLWVGRVPARGMAGAILLDDVLVAGESASAIERTAPYLVHLTRTAEAPPGLTIRLIGDTVPVRLRATLDELLAEHAGRGLAAIRAERAQQQAPPRLGDPEVLVQALRDVAASLLARLPDVEETVVDLRSTAGGLRLDVHASVREGSPLARDLAAASVGPPSGLGALPASTALGWWTRTAPSPEPSWVAATLERLGGDRLDPAGRGALRAADEAIGTSRGAGVVVGLGAEPGAPWLLAGSSDARAPLAAEPLRAALAARYLAQLGGTLLGCAGPARPRSLRNVEGELRGAACGSGSPWLVTAASGDGWAGGVVAGEATVTRELAGRLGSGTAGGGLGSEPDVERALGELGDEVLLAGVLVPSRLLDALRLFGPLRERLRDPAGIGRTAPLVVGVSRTERGLSLRVEATRDATTDLIAIARPFLAAD